MSGLIPFIQKLIPRKHEEHQMEDLLASLFVIAWMVEARDAYTGGHLWRVSQYSKMLAEALGLPKYEIARITLGGFLHDLGKVNVPDSILNKKGKLTDDEYNIIKTHPEVGIRIIAGHPLLELVKSAIVFHHETPNGNGYPYGLKGADIPTDALIVGLCDAFDAMTSSRPYRARMSIPEASERIKENKSSQFDAKITECFLELSHSGKLDHIVGHSDEGIPLQSCLSCGPIIVLKASQVDGDSAYCPACTTKYVVKLTKGEFELEPTNIKGSPTDLEPQADLDLIQRAVRQSSQVLAAGLMH